MKQKLVTIFTGTDEGGVDHQERIDRYLKDGWAIKQISTAYTERACFGLSVAITLLHDKLDD